MMDTYITEILLLDYFVVAAINYNNCSECYERK